MYIILAGLLTAGILFFYLFAATQQQIFFVLISFLGTAAVMGAYLKNKIISVIILAVCCFLAGSTYYFQVHPIFSFFMAVAFIALYLMSSTKEEVARNQQIGFREQIRKEKNMYDDLVKETERIDKFNEEVNRQSEEIENLYEITKRMSVFLQFDEIFKILCSELKNTFEFDDCRLITLKSAAPGYEIEAVYDIPMEGRIKDAKSYDLKIVEILYQNRQTLKINSREEAEQIGISLPIKIKTLLAIPLVVENDVIGVVISENIQEKNFDKFSIVIGQFTLELRKVKLYQLIENLAITDGLTRLLLRRQFLKSFEKEFQRSLNNKLKISVLMIDIDHFKKFNDRYGHLMGDRVLVRIADIIKHNTREIDLVCRYGGEEFAVALPETEKKGAFVVAERIRSEVERENFVVEGEFKRATVSIGVACFPEDGKEMTAVIDASDKALYHAKNSGRNMTCMFEDKST